MTNRTGSINKGASKYVPIKANRTTFIMVNIIGDPVGNGINPNI
jgi:hypothetical protein